MRDLRMVAGEPSVYAMTSSGSGKRVDIHFCSRCGTKIYLTFERFPDVAGVYAGTFDDPSWFDRKPEITACLFQDNAQAGAILPAGVPVYRQHRSSNDGAPNAPVTFSTPYEVRREPPRS